MMFIIHVVSVYSFVLIGWFGIYWQWFRSVGDFTFSWSEETYTYKELKETDHRIAFLSN